MKKITCLLLLVLAALPGRSQQYAPLQPGIKRYFINKVGYLRGMRVDSVVQENGYVRYKAFGRRVLPPGAVPSPIPMARAG